MRRKLSKVMAYLLTLCMLMSLLPTTAFAIPATHSHAICGAAHTDIGDHTGTCADVEWTAWDGTTDFPGGNVYLSADVTLDETLKISSGTVNLCLNGKVLKISDSAVVRGVLEVSEGATLNICDCQTAEHKFSPDESGLWVLDEENGTKSVSGGVITGGSANVGSAINSNGTLRIYGGNIVGNRGRSRAVVYSSGAEFSMYGGSICGNTGDEWNEGVGLYLLNHEGKHQIRGGKIYENKTVAYDSPEGVGIYVSIGNLTISGAVEIYDNKRGTENDNIYMPWNRNQEYILIIDGELTNTKPIGVWARYEDVVIKAEGTTVTDLTDYMDNFTPDNTGRALQLSADKKNINLLSPHKHTVCLAQTCTHDTNPDTEGVQAHEEVEWIGIDDLDAIEAAGYYYLTDDIDLNDSSWSTPYDMEGKIAICLNGHEITGESGLLIGLDSDFAVTDCGTTGKVTSTGETYGHAIWISGCSFELYGGTISSVATDVSAVWNQNKGTFSQYGGTVKSEKHTAIQSLNLSTVNLYGGTIEAAIAGIDASETIVNLYGGDITSQYGLGAFETNVNLYGKMNINSITADFAVAIASGSNSKIVMNDAIAKPTTPYSISVDSATPFTSGWSTYMSSADISEYFTSAANELKIVKNSSGELIAKPYGDYKINTTTLSEVQEILDGIATVTQSGSVITIKLTDDVLGRIEFQDIGGEFVLDLNGKTIEGGIKNEAISLGNNFTGTATITGSGTLKTGVNNIIYKGSGSTLNFDVSSGKDYFTLKNGTENVFTNEKNKEKTALSGTYIRGEILTLEQGTLQTFTISFNANGGEGIMADDDAKDGESFTLPSNGFTAKAGWEFSGWAKSADGAVIEDVAITITDDTELFARWGKLPATIPVISGTSADLEYGNALTYGNIDSDDKISVTATAANDTEYNLSYQWYNSNSMNGENATIVSGATESSYTIPTNTEAGEAWYYCVVIATRKDNAEAATRKSNIIHVVVNKAKPTLNNAPTAKENLVYNGGAKLLIDSGAATNGTIEYAFGENATTVPITGWNSTVSEKREAGTYYVWYRVNGKNNNYSDLSPKCVVATIQKCPVEISWGTTSFVYDGTEKSVTASVSNKAPNDTVVLTLSGNTATDVDDYTAAVTAVNNPNYTLESVTTTKAWSIVRSASSSAVKKILNGETETDAFTYGDTITVKIKPQATGQAAPAPMMLMSLTPPVENQMALYYNGTQVSDAVSADGEGYYTITLDTTSNLLPAGNVCLTAEYTGNDNMAGYSEPITLTLNKAASSVTAPVPVENLVYNGNGQILISAVTNFVGGTVKYKLDGGEYSTELPQATNAGTYTVYYKVFGDDYHNDTTENSVSVTIAKATQSAPTTPAAVAETIKGKADGKITGVTSNMEYKKQNDENYTGITGETVENLAIGTYFVRYKEDANHFASEDAQVVIAEGVMISVSFNSNEGTAVESKTCEYNQAITAPAEPTKDGFEFIAWYLEDTLTTKWTNEYLFTVDTTLYAKWVHGTVSDHEDHVDEVEANGLNDVAKTEETDIELIVQIEEALEGDTEQTAIKAFENAPSNFGFYDIKLEKSAGGNVTDASGVIEIKLPYDFTRKTNIKVYRHHGGSPEELTQLDLRAATPYVDGKCYVDKESGCIYIYSSKFSTYAVAYDAVRSSSGGGTTRYTVKFDTDGGSKVSNKTVTRNSTLAEPTEPTKDGYTFIGWFTDKELTKAYDFDTKVTKSFTLYAKWEKVEDDKKDETDDKTDTTVWENPFEDVKADDWYYADVEYAAQNGLFNGTSETTFAPNSIITRAMMVTVLYRNEGEPEVTGETTFHDVDENAYYAKAVVWGQQNGIIKGYSETEFAPDENITREQIAAIMHRYAKYKGYDVSVGENTNILSYDDFASISEYAIASMQYAVGSGLMKGKTESTLNPQDNATRAEIAAILHRFIEANK